MGNIVQYNMQKIVSIFLIILVTKTKAEFKEDLEDVVKNIMLDVGEIRYELNRTKEELKAKDDSIHKLQIEMKIKDDQLEKDLKAKEESIRKLEKKIQEKTDQLERDMSLLSDPPHTFTCSSHYTTLTISSQRIPYTSLLYSSTNVDGAYMDTGAGVFTAGMGGTYTVTWSLAAWDGAGDTSVDVYLRRNKETIVESHHGSYYSGPSGVVDNQGGRTLVLHLDRGDTLDLWCEDCDAGIGHVTFCVSQSTYDV